jgi:imidazolonepropionase-like amidohydrolase
VLLQRAKWSLREVNMYKIIAENVFDGNKTLKDRVILFDEKGIHHIGSDINEKVKETFKVKFVTPGFIDLASGIGLREESLGRVEGVDLNEETNPQTPELVALDGINPYDEAFPKSVRGGVTKSLILPGISNSIGGRGSLIFNFGGNILEMLIKSPFGVRFSINNMPKAVYIGQKKMPMTRMGNAYLIREALFKAKEYRKNKKKFSLFEESLLPILEGKDKAFFSSFRADDIVTGLRISDEFKLDTIITYGFESDLVMDKIKKRKTPVAFGPLILARDSTELRHLSPEVPVNLIENGIETALISGHPPFPAEFLRLQVGLLIREGLNSDKALTTITSVPAKILGMENFGRLKDGSKCDLVLFDGEPWETKSQVEKVFIKGKEVYNHKA